MDNKNFTIIGNPVSHSKSPALFRAAYPMYSNFTYDASEVKSAEEGIALFKSKYNGGNVTAPFKESILQYANEVSEEAGLIGAANCILVTLDGEIHASNTDYLGVCGSLEEHNVKIKGKRCVLLGAGGAGKAAAFGLHCSEGDLTIVNRTENTAKKISEKIGCNYSGLDRLNTLISEADIIVNTLYPDIDIINEEYLNPKQVVLDASYVGSIFLNKARQRGCKCIDGKYWLFHQAVPAFTLFTGITPNKQAMRKIIGIDSKHSN